MGLAAVDEGLKCVRDNGEHWGEAELHRIKGALLLSRGMRDAAISCCRSALDIASAQQARAYRLRAANDLAQRLTEAYKLLEKQLRR